MRHLGALWQRNWMNWVSSLVRLTLIFGCNLKSKGDGKEYYEYAMMYVGDAMTASHQAIKVMEELGKGVKYKNDKIEIPDSYLGTQLVRKTLPSGIKCWCIPSDKYVNAAVKNVEEAIKIKS